MDLAQDELNDPTQPHGLGDSVTLSSHRPPQDYEAPPQDYRVIERNLLLTEWTDQGYLVQELLYIVSDPGE